MNASDFKTHIIQLAIRGELFPQNSQDTPGGILLDQINNKRNITNNKKSIIYKKNKHYYEKLGKKEPICIDEEIPFDIPDNWEWCRINTICEVYTGNSINKKEKESNFTGLNEGYNYIGTKDVGFDKSIDYENGVKIPKNLEKFKVAPSGSILLCIEGGSAGRKIGFLDQDVCFGNKLACFKSFGDFNKFLFYYLQSHEFKKIFISKKTGIIGGVSISKLRNVLVPLPPLEEQKRITDVLNEVDEYVLLDDKLNEINNKFVNNFKSLILQEAIQGNLVPQDSNEESALILLSNIKKEKEKLVKQGKIKKNKQESIIYQEKSHYYELIGKNGKPVCIDDEIPFHIPENWEWCRLDNVCSKITDGSHNPPPKKESGIPVLSVKNIDCDKIDFSTVTRFTDEAGFNKENKRTNITRGDVLLGIIGGSIGEVCIYESDIKVIAQRSLAVIKPLILNKYLEIILRSNFFEEFANDKSKGSAQNGLYLSALREFLVPIPPFNEQKRIVSKVEELFENADILIFED